MSGLAKRFRSKPSEQPLKYNNQSYNLSTICEKLKKKKSTEIHRPTLPFEILYVEMKIFLLWLEMESSQS